MRMRCLSAPSASTTRSDLIRYRARIAGVARNRSVRMNCESGSLFLTATVRVRGQAGSR
jgi:hypothetical protein